jgi:DNA (cytosine-5)-methyltransferase 1
MKIVDLFSGCGGMSLGFQNAGFEVAAAFDNWIPAIEVYQQNFNHPIFQQDLSKVDESIDLISEFNPEMLIGGPPCQDFSSAGKRDVTLGRADLTTNFGEIVKAIKPNWFVMENVEQIKKSHILREVIESLNNDYGLTTVILNAAYCGAPQSRTRFFLVGCKGGNHNALTSVFQRNLSERAMTMRDYFGDRLCTEYYYRHPRNYNRRAVYGLDEPSATIRGVNRPIPAGYSFNKNDPKGISMNDVRPLTTDERAQVQTFPETFKWLGTKTNREQMIGNAVPVALGAFVGKCILDFLKNGSEPMSDLFSYEDVVIAERYLRPN